MTINNVHRYLQGVWDWGILDGCFGSSRIQPTDIDGFIERRGHKLFIETKAPGVELPDHDGQMIALRSLVNDGCSVMILWGQQNQPEKMRLLVGDCDRIEYVTLDRVRQIISQWYQWADRTPYHRPTATHRTPASTGRPARYNPTTGETDTMSYQQITLLGNLGNDPETRQTPSGVAVTSFSLAVSRQWTDASGTKKDKTVWFRVSVWGNQAEACSAYLHKGSKVLVVGEVEEARAYTDRDGNARASLEVRAQTVQFLDGAREGSEAAQRTTRTPAKATLQDEEIPF